MSLLFRSKYCWNLHGVLSMSVTMYQHGGCQLESKQDESIKPCKSIKTSHCAVFSYCLLRGMRSAKGIKMHIVGFVNNMQRTRAIGTIMGVNKKVSCKKSKKKPGVPLENNIFVICTLKWTLLLSSLVHMIAPSPSHIPLPSITFSKL